MELEGNLVWIFAGGIRALLSNNNQGAPRRNASICGGFLFALFLMLWLQRDVWGLGRDPSSPRPAQELSRDFSRKGIRSEFESSQCGMGRNPFYPCKRGNEEQRSKGAVNPKSNLPGITFLLPSSRVVKLEKFCKSDPLKKNKFYNFFKKNLVSQHP